MLLLNSGPIRTSVPRIVLRITSSRGLDFGGACLLAEVACTARDGTDREVDQQHPPFGRADGGMVRVGS